MATTAKTTAKRSEAPQLSRTQIDEVLKILKDVDSVELKMVAPMQTHHATIQKLGLDPIEAEVRQVYFFDTPSLDLNKVGVVVRARRIQGGDGDTVIKLRPADPGLREQRRRRAEFGR
jgi:adenylate cyclase class IV